MDKKRSDYWVRFVFLVHEGRLQRGGARGTLGVCSGRTKKASEIRERESTAHQVRSVKTPE